MINKVLDTLVAAQENTYDELKRALIELKAGRYEEVYNILTDVTDGIATDIIRGR